MRNLRVLICMISLLFFSTSNTWAQEATSNSSFEATQRLEIREGLTVSVTWDKGFVAAPQKSSFALLWPKIFFILSILLLITGYIAIWLYWSQAPKKGSVYPEYSPPFGLEAGYIGYAKTLQFSTVTLLADLFQLAIQGQIIINPSKDCIEIEKNAQEWPPEISQSHQRLMSALFAKFPQTVRLSGVWEFSVVSAPSLIEHMPKFYNLSRTEVPFSSGRPSLTKWNLLLHLTNLALFLPLALVVVLVDTPFPFGLRTDNVWVVTIIPPATLLLCYFWNFKRHLKSRKSHRVRVLPMAKALQFTTLCAVSVFNILKFYYTPNIILLLVIWVALFTAFFFSYTISTPTKTGRMLMDRVEGFEMYLNTAEKDRIESFYPTFEDAAPDRSLETYERFLPYALALGVADAWTETHSALMEAQNYSPQWYRDWQGPSSFKTDNLRALIDAISPP